MSRYGTMSETETQAAYKLLQENGYTIISKLGHGSYANVMLAHSERHKSEVAVKIIAKGQAPHEVLVKFLPRELEIVGKLKHRNIVLFYETIETNTSVYIVMEAAKGGDLLHFVRQKVRVKEVTAGPIFKQILDGIEYCHFMGVVHRDLKAENLLFDTNGNVKIVDFGFAREKMTKVDGNFTRSETYCGSYAYAAPEILMGTPYIPQLADIWSIGIILYVMVIGRLPFEDTNHKRLLRLILAGPVFPEERETSDSYKNLVKQILQLESARLQDYQIRVTAWYTEYAKGIQTSASN